MYLIESVLFSTIICIINCAYYPLSFMFIGDTVNPYQVLSLFMAIRYGSVRGFISFLIIISIGGGNAFFNSQADKLFDTQTLYFVLSVLLTSHVAGQLSDYQNDEIFFLRDRYDKLSLDFQKCTLNYLMLTDANKELTQKIVTRFQSLSTVYEAAQKLETLSIDKLFPSALELLESHTSVKTAAVYILKDGILYLKAHLGSKGEVVFAEALKPDSDKMIFNAIKNRKTVSQREDIFDLSKEYYSDECGGHLIVAPIMLNETVNGVVVIEKISFENFTDATIRIISMIADWVAMCINKIDNFSKIEAEVPIDQEINCYKVDHLKKMIRIEVAKAVRYRLQLSVCKVAIADHDKLTEKMRRSVYFTIGYIVKNCVRDIDFYGACMENGCFVIILPVTDSKGSNILISRLTNELGNFKIKPYENEEQELQVSAGCYSLFDIIPEKKINSIPFEKLREETENAYATILKEMKI